mgnify:CR=1 FL=1
MDTAEIEWRSPLLPNDIRFKSATLLEPNHKTKDKPQTLFCFVHQTPNQNEAKWTVSLFENVKGKSSPKWIGPKILKKVDTLYLVWETLLPFFPPLFPLSHFPSSSPFLFISSFLFVFFPSFFCPPFSLSPLPPCSPSSFHCPTIPSTLPTPCYKRRRTIPYRFETPLLQHTTDRSKQSLPSTLCRRQKVPNGNASVLGGLASGRVGRRCGRVETGMDCWGR